MPARTAALLVQVQYNYNKKAGCGLNRRLVIGCYTACSLAFVVGLILRLKGSMDRGIAKQRLVNNSADSWDYVFNDTQSAELIQAQSALESAETSMTFGVALMIISGIAIVALFIGSKVKGGAK